MRPLTSVRRPRGLRSRSSPSCGLFGDPEAVPPTRPAPAASSGASSPRRQRPSPGSAVATPTAAAPDLSRFYDQKVKWTNCGDADCATIIAPLDYSDPEGPTIDLAITRVKATGRQDRLALRQPGRSRRQRRRLRQGGRRHRQPEDPRVLRRRRPRPARRRPQRPGRLHDGRADRRARCGGRHAGQRRRGAADRATSTLPGEGCARSRTRGTPTSAPSTRHATSTSPARW